MKKIECAVPRARQAQIGQAFRAGKKAAAAMQIADPFFRQLAAEATNPFSVRGLMPDDLATTAGVLWHAFNSGVAAGCGNISGAATLLRNARFLGRRAVARADLI